METLKSNYIESFWDKTYRAYNDGKISEHERKALNKLYDSKKRIDAESQLRGYCKRMYKIKY